MTLPLPILVLGAGVIFTFYFLFKNENRRYLLASEHSTNRLSSKYDTIPCGNQNVSGDKCVICQCDYDDENQRLVKLVCEHKYHQKCIDKWFEVERICPVCRKYV